MMGRTCSIGDRSAGQSFTCTCLWNHVVVAHAEWELALSWSNNHGLPMKDIILMAVCLCTIYQYMPPCQWHLNTYASHPCCLLCSTPIPWQTCAFASVADEKSGWSLWSLGLSTAHFHYLFWLSEMSTGPENPVLSLHKMYSFLLE